MKKLIQIIFFFFYLTIYCQGYKIVVKDNFSIKIPKNWELSTSNPLYFQDNILLAHEPLQESATGLMSSVGVDKIDCSGKSIEEYLYEKYGLVKGDYTTKVVNDYKLTIYDFPVDVSKIFNDQDVEQLSDWEKAIINTKQYQCILKRQNYFYKIDISSVGDKFSKRKIRKILYSFEFFD